MKDRKVIAGVREVWRAVRKTKSGDYYYHAEETQHIFDTYADFENYQNNLRIENADPKRETAKIIVWWWWYD